VTSRLFDQDYADLGRAAQVSQIAVAWQLTRFVIITNCSTGVSPSRLRSGDASRTWALIPHATMRTHQGYSRNRQESHPFQRGMARMTDSPSTRR